MPAVAQMRIPTEMAVAPAAQIDSSVGWVREVIASERDALDRFLSAIPASVPTVVALLAAQERPVACIGIGKSGLVAAKVAATLSSLGTPAFFVNAAEAAHGDLGAVQPGTVTLLFSNSGTTDEILRILPMLQARGCTLVSIVGRPDSPLGRAAHHLIPATITREADHIDMAPTASTTLQMAIGDSLAVAAARARGLDRTDFLQHHPAGLLGRQQIPVRTLMRSGADLPRVLPSASVAELLAVMSGHRMGAACVVGHDGRLLGLVVDGDIRRHIQAHRDLYAITASELMEPNPQTIDVSATLGEALALLRTRGSGLLVLPVVDADGALHGLLPASDLLSGGAA